MATPKPGDSHGEGWASRRGKSRPPGATSRLWHSRRRGAAEAAARWKEEEAQRQWRAAQACVGRRGGVSGGGQARRGQRRCRLARREAAGGDAGDERQGHLDEGGQEGRQGEGQEAVGFPHRHGRPQGRHALQRQCQTHPLLHPPLPWCGGRDDGGGQEHHDGGATTQGGNHVIARINYPLASRDDDRILGRLTRIQRWEVETIPSVGFYIEMFLTVS
uniref:Uncharacterized protein n=1 Tax=Oryza nivara TaxID=4536 RepID=A0A0E0IPH2_ORYNI